MKNGKNFPGKKRIVSRIKPSRVVKKKGREVARSLLGRQRVWFTHHALMRMEQRSVEESDVFAALENPTRKGLKTAPATQRWRMDRPGKKPIDVVFRVSIDSVVIITVIKL